MYLRFVYIISVSFQAIRCAASSSYKDPLEQDEACGNDKLQCGIELLQRKAVKAEPGSCTCIPWADVYKTRQVSCGQGLELFSWMISANMTGLQASDPLLFVLKSKLGRVFCSNFFEKFTENSCVNAKFMVTPDEANKWYAQSWCYVSSECTELNGGGHVPGTWASWKVCHSAKDTLLRDKSPAELFALAREHSVDAGFITGMAYFYDDKDPAELLPDELYEIGQQGQKVIFWPSGEYSKPRILIAGEEQWGLDFNHTAGKLGNAGEFWSPTCHAGCSLNNKQVATNASVKVADAHPTAVPSSVAAVVATTDTAAHTFEAETAAPVMHSASKVAIRKVGSNKQRPVLLAGRQMRSERLFAAKDVQAEARLYRTFTPGVLPVYTGETLRSGSSELVMKSSGALGCKRMCDAVAGCFAVTLIDNTCYLKNGNFSVAGVKEMRNTSFYYIEPQAPLSELVAAPREARVYKTALGLPQNAGHVLSFYGEEFALDATSSWDCEKLCDATQDCAAFAIRKFGPTFKCFFKDSTYVDHNYTNASLWEFHMVPAAPARTYKMRSGIPHIEGKKLTLDGKQHTMPARTAEECMKVCDETQGCAAFAMTSVGMYRKCFFKDKTFRDANYTRKSGTWEFYMMSGRKARKYKIGSGLPQNQGRNLHFNGKEFSTSVPKAKDCQNLCDGTPGCGAFAIQTHGNHSVCLLKDNSFSDANFYSSSGWQFYMVAEVLKAHQSKAMPSTNASSEPSVKPQQKASIMTPARLRELARGPREDRSYSSFQWSEIPKIEGRTLKFGAKELTLTVSGNGLACKKLCDALAGCEAFTIIGTTAKTCIFKDGAWSKTAGFKTAQNARFFYVEGENGTRKLSPLELFAKNARHIRREAREYIQGAKNELPTVEGRPLAFVSDSLSFVANHVGDCKHLCDATEGCSAFRINTFNMCFFHDDSYNLTKTKPTPGWRFYSIHPKEMETDAEYAQEYLLRADKGMAADIQIRRYQSSTVGKIPLWDGSPVNHESKSDNLFGDIRDCKRACDAEKGCYAFSFKDNRCFFKDGTFNMAGGTRNMPGWQWVYVK